MVPSVVAIEAQVILRVLMFRCSWADISIVELIVKIGLVDSVNESIIPEVTNAERSTVDVVMQYCTAVPAG